LLTALLDGHQSAQLRRRIASAAAEAAGFAAWLWFDLGDLGSCRRCYQEAAQAVSEAGDAGLGSYLKGYQGLVAAQLDDVRGANDHLREAVETAPRSLSGITRAWLMTLQAQAFAHAGQTEAATRAVHDAQNYLTESRAPGADPWMYDFDQGGLAAHSGVCYLAVNQPDQAVDAFTQALRLLPPSCDRRGAKIRIGLAHAHLIRGDADEALRLGVTALVTLAHRGSVAGLRSVRELRGAFVRAGLPAAASALDEQARQLQSCP
jgi:tetratricopeptide (TPR) repeat protein